jgi:hypothetical protein
LGSGGFREKNQLDILLLAFRSQVLVKGISDILFVRKEAGIEGLRYFLKPAFQSTPSKTGFGFIPRLSKSKAFISFLA